MPRNDSYWRQLTEVLIHYIQWMKRLISAAKTALLQENECDTEEYEFPDMNNLTHFQDC